jgi:hypothetical protein
LNPGPFLGLARSRSLRLIGRDNFGCPDAPFIRIPTSGLLGAGDYDRFEPKFAAELKRRKVPISGVLDCPPDTLRAPHLLLDIALRSSSIPGLRPVTRDKPDVTSVLSATRQAGRRSLALRAASRLLRNRLRSAFSTENVN